MSEKVKIGQGSYSIENGKLYEHRLLRKIEVTEEDNSAYTQLYQLVLNALNSNIKFTPQK